MGWPRILALAALAGLELVSAAAPAQAGAGAPMTIRGPHVSGGVQVAAGLAPSASTTAVSCSTPGTGGNYKLNCHGHGFPVNEVSAAASPSGGYYVAGANDYNSYNGEGQAGFYASRDGKTWYDAGPVDIFPHALLNAFSDPGLAVDATNVVYYSGVLFNPTNCNFGGLQLMRRDPVSGAWSSWQIAANTSGQFQDKPSLAMVGGYVLVSWTQFASCSGSGVPSPIKIAALKPGAASTAPVAILSVPGSTYSQGSAMAGSGGDLWVTWEEFASAAATNGAIMLAHWTQRSGWGAPVKISPPGFTDLPPALPGFRFRTNSFPEITFVPGVGPVVAWSSFDTGIGRVYLWSGATGVHLLSDSGGDQFFPSLALNSPALGPASGIFVSYGQTDRTALTYDQYLASTTGVGVTVSKVSSAPSHPNGDAFFQGRFIGDYGALISSGGSPHPFWTDIRGPDPILGYEMDAFTDF